MDYEEYKNLKGADFIKASKEHPEFMEKHQKERTQRLLRNGDLEIALRYVARRNKYHHDDQAFKEQMRALFVSFCITNGVIEFSKEYDAILAEFAKEYEPEDVKVFFQFMSEYIELDETQENADIAKYLGL